MMRPGKILILALPFFLLVIVNESMRGRVKEDVYSRSGIAAINPGQALKNRCSWHCHNNTTYCKQNHVRIARKYFNLVDPVYFGLIALLASTGSYDLANIIILVVLWPLLMYYLIIKNIELWIQLKKSRRKDV